MGANTDPTQVLAKILLGQTLAPSAFGVVEGVVVSSTATTVKVTINEFGEASQTFTCNYEKRTGASPSTPPKGTACLVAFPENSPSGTPWALAFTGWPG